MVDNSVKHFREYDYYFDPREKSREIARRMWDAVEVPELDWVEGHTQEVMEGSTCQT